MKKRFFENLGNAVHKTPYSKDLNDLGRNIDDILSEVKTTVQNVMEQSFFDPLRPPSSQKEKQSDFSGQSKESKTHGQGKKGYTPPNTWWQGSANGSYQADTAREQNFNNTSFNSWQYAHQTPIQKQNLIRKPAKGNGVGITFTILGGLLVLTSIVSLLSRGVYFLTEMAYSSLTMLGIVTLPLLCLGIIFYMIGGSMRARYKRCKKYLNLTGTASFISLKQLAEEMGQKQDFIVSDLKWLIRKKYIIGAHLDDQGTCLMLDNKTYEQYIVAQEAYKKRQEEEEKRRRERERDPFVDSLYRTIEEGEDYITQIKAANDAIPAEDISAELFKLEQIVGRIFEHIKKNPKKLPEISRFMRYYLPTTLKLVNAYREFESQSVQGENIRTTKQEIQSALKTINKAFENLLDSLFEHDALDISTDISALHSMLAQEGLTESEFSMKQPDDK